MELRFDRYRCEREKTIRGLIKIGLFQLFFKHLRWHYYLNLFENKLSHTKPTIGFGTYCLCGEKRQKDECMFTKHTFIFLSFFILSLRFNRSSLKNQELDMA